MTNAQPGFTDPSEIDVCDRTAIARLIYEHSHLVDRGQADKLHELYVDDGRLIAAEFSVVGREALKAYGLKRKATGRTSRHVITNIRLERVAPNRISAISIATVYRSEGADRTSTLPGSIADFVDSFVKGSDCIWRFEERRIIRVFEASMGSIPARAER